MKLTHHASPTRSFIIIAIIVLATVYASLLLMDAQLEFAVTNKVAGPSRLEAGIINTNDWQIYQEEQFQLSLMLPEDWNVTSSEPFPGYYLVDLAPQDDIGSVRIFVSKLGYAGVTDRKQASVTNTSGVKFDTHGDLIYTAKVGDYYYTFDGSIAPSLDEELKQIVRLARF